MTKREKREQFFAQPRTKIEGVRDDIIEFYKLEQTGQIIGEFHLDLGLFDEPVEIGFFADTHVNYCDEIDMQDEEIAYSYECRQWLKHGETVPVMIAAMDVCEHMDATVVGGDTLDYLSHGAMELVKKHIFDRDPTVLSCVANHDITKQMETKKPDKLSHDERYAILQTIWPHDIHFATRTLNEKLTLVALNNTPPGYSDYVHEKLKAEIESARREGRKILLFEHEPITTGNPADIEVKPYWILNRDLDNFYNGGSWLCRFETMSEQNRKTYDLICSSADVIKCIICGHLHSAYYNEILASYTDEDGKHDAVIPQISYAANAYLYGRKFGENKFENSWRVGNIMRMIVK